MKNMTWFDNGFDDDERLKGGHFVPAALSSCSILQVQCLMTFWGLPGVINQLKSNQRLDHPDFTFWKLDRNDSFYSMYTL